MTREEIQNRISSLDTSIQALWGEISIADDGQTESSLWKSVADMESERAELEIQLRGLPTDEDDEGVDVLYFDDSEIVAVENKIVVLGGFYEALRNELARRPERLYELNPRQFEELVAGLLSDFDYECELTPQTRDRGVRYLCAPAQGAYFVLGLRRVQEILFSE